MLKKTLIAAATTIALAGTAAVTTTPAAAAPAVTVDIAWSGPGFKHGHRNWHRGRACQPIVRWRTVGYRHHQRRQPVVVGWNCHGGHKGHHHRRWR